MCVCACVCPTVTDNQGHYANDGTLHTSLVTFFLSFLLHFVLVTSYLCPPSLPLLCPLVHVGVSAQQQVLPLQLLYAGLGEDVNCK